MGIGQVEITREAVRYGIFASREVLRVVACIPRHGVPGVIAGDGIVDGGFNRVMV